MNYLKLSIRYCIFFIAFLIFFSVNLAYAVMVTGNYMGDEVPIERVVANLEKKLSEIKSSDYRYKDRFVAQHVSTLARVHAMAYAFKLKTIKSYTGKKVEDKVYVRFPMPGHEDTGVFNDSPRQFPETVVKAENSADELKAKEHFERAVSLYRQIESERKDVQAMLGLGWLLMHAGKKQEARDQFEKILNLNEKSALDSVNPPKGYKIETSIGGVIEAEAAHYLISLLDPNKDAKKIKKITKRVYGAYRKYVAQGQLMSPIAIPLSNEYTRADLLDLDAAVSFNLDGSGMPQKWSWITPKAAWLVFIPKEQAMSGMFLFGEVTFWAFWNNGYQALCALDDSQDGVISGDELTRIGLWQDRDSDGVMTKDELITLKSQGIAGFRCDGAQVKEGEYWHPQGAMLSSGETRPTYDFLLKRVK